MLCGFLLQGFEFDEVPRTDRVFRTQADLRRADLPECGGLAEEQLADARIEDSTRLPPALPELATRWIGDCGSPTVPRPAGDP
ncbi:hypothetical protein [Streptomyces sp. CT34]|uniref:hypothetical protein n=1 Tax=Streptomyces sp. CT34 TaxID=1553907 RepID=UPI0005BC086C|nr:hypothetical protein [Streptomyces sp. CT34]